MPFAIQAMCGVAFISNYTAYYMVLTGIATHTTFQVYCGARALSLSGNIVAFWLYDRVGCRPLILYAFGFLTFFSWLLVAWEQWPRISQQYWVSFATFPYKPQILTYHLYSYCVIMVFYCFVYNLANGAVVWAIIGETPTARLRTETIAISGIV